MLDDAEAKEAHQDEQKEAQEQQDEPSLEGVETSGIRAGHSGVICASRVGNVSLSGI